MQEVSEREAAEGLAGRAMTEFGGLLRPFMDRQMPDCLRQGAPPPESWTGSAESWEELASKAREAFEQKPYLEAALAVGQRGFTPHELISGRLTPGSALNVATGRVRRPLSTELEGKARRALHELRQRNLTVDAPLQVALEQASAGGWTSEPGQVEGAVKAAEAAVRTYDRERELAREEKAGKVKVRVLATAGPGRRYSPGTYRLTAEELAELEEWAVKVVEGARGRSLGSLGHAIWPAFSVETD